MESFRAEWNSGDLKGAIKLGFSFIELKDKIVGFIHIHPSLIKPLLLSAPEEDIHFDYIPEGVGMIRTAYLKYKFGKTNEIIFRDTDKTEEVTVTLI